MPGSVKYLLLGCVAFLHGCVAPVKMEAFPAAGVNVQSQTGCQGMYDGIAVLGSLPTQGTYEELGFMNLSQQSTSEFVAVSTEAQIKAARIRACEWGADAIVIMGSDADQSTSWNFFSGLQNTKSKETRAIAIKYVAADPAPISPGAVTETPTVVKVEPMPPTADADQKHRIDLYLEHPGTVLVEIGPKGGNIVRMLVIEDASVGACAVAWDGKNEEGVGVAVGPYRYSASQNAKEIASGWLNVR